MAAFEKSSGMGGSPDMDDILAQMFGFSMGGGGFPGGPGMGPGGMGNGKRKGADEEKQYEVTLEELYRGKTVKFASTKNVVCSTCNGTGGKEKAKPQICSVCGGKGKQIAEWGCEDALKCDAFDLLHEFLRDSWRNAATIRVSQESWKTTL
jgi:DnaJ family protein A protein 2